MRASRGDGRFGVLPPSGLPGRFQVNGKDAGKGSAVSVWWCLHCQRVHSGGETAKDCPYCGASAYGDVWLYTDLDSQMPPAHWPTEPPPDGTQLDLYR